MKVALLFAAAVAVFSLLPATIWAQDSPLPDDTDTAQIYHMGEVVVRGDSIRRSVATTVSHIPTARLARADAMTAALLTYQIPSARIQTNSRGESLIYMRSSGDRQIGLFFDGVLLNVPWDNRIDLSLVPTAAVGGITVSRGAPSVLYGANSMGGTINMVSVGRNSEGSNTDIQTQVGTDGLLGGSIVHTGSSGTFRYVGEASYTGRDGFSVPDGADLPFNQNNSDLRTNTDLRSLSLYARGENRFSESAEIGLAVHYVDAEKGVAPEGHVGDTRFWRYPTWRNITASLNSEIDFGDNDQWVFRGAAWGTRFAQDIESFSDSTYSIRSDMEEDRDLSFGTRLLLHRTIGDGGITLALNGLTAAHDQRDIAFDSVGGLVELRDTNNTVIPYPTVSYAQLLYSVGVEAEQRFDVLQVTVGASLDGMSTPRTGDKPAQEPFSDYSIVGGASYDIMPTLSVRASTGRRTRFPTMRELYGEAIRRFVLNPALKPEETWVSEAGLDGRGEWGSVSLVGFAYLTSNTIDQRRFDTLGGAKRQRINLPGSRAFGGEVSGNIRAFAPLRLDGHFTYSYARGHATSVDGADSIFHLTEKPDIISLLSLRYDFDFGLTPSLEIIHTGEAFSPNDDNEFIRLAPSTIFNVRLSYRFQPWNTSIAQLFLRVNNITDHLVLPQIGLPAPGREILGGIKLSL